MGRTKGCINEECVVNQKKIIFNEANDYCSKCGNKLYYVCRECYTQLPDSLKKYCVRCLAERHDRKDHALKAAGGVAVSIGIVAAGAAKTIIKGISKFK